LSTCSYLMASQPPIYHCQTLFKHNQPLTPLQATKQSQITMNN
jgi:hypothetical protein